MTTPNGPIGAAILAAGASTRMGGPNKLLEPVGGETMVWRVVDTVLAAGVQPIVVVTGHDAETIARALHDKPVEVVPNPRWREGIGTSVAAAAAALEGRVAGAFFCLADMPRVVANDLRFLIAAFRSDRKGSAVWIPTYGGQRGNPVLWSGEALAELRRLSGDHGASALFAHYAGRTVDVPASDGVLVDADTPEALEELRRLDWPNALG